MSIHHNVSDQPQHPGVGAFQASAGVLIDAVTQGFTVWLCRDVIYNGKMVPQILSVAAFATKDEAHRAYRDLMHNLCGLHQLLHEHPRDGDLIVDSFFEYLGEMAQTSTAPVMPFDGEQAKVILEIIAKAKAARDAQIAPGSSPITPGQSRLTWLNAQTGDVQIDYHPHVNGDDSRS